MPSLVDAVTLWAQAANPPAPGAGGEGGLLPTLIMFLPIILLFYFMILRPQQQQERRRRQMIDALKKNDKVLTAAGIYGTVVSIDPEDDRVVIRVAENVKMEFTRGSIARVLNGDSERDKAVEAKKEKPVEAK